MKTPEEWKALYDLRVFGPEIQDWFIRKIQSDALRHAAAMIEGHDRCTLRSIRMRWAKRFEQEATKLEE